MKKKNDLEGFIQLDLFASPFRKYNRAIKLLLELKFRHAERLLEEFKRIDQGKRDLGLEYDIIAFLREHESILAHDADPRTAFRLWEERWEELYRKESARTGLLSSFRRSYFRHVSSFLAPGTNPDLTEEKIFLDGTALLIMIRGEFLQEVSSMASKVAEVSREPGRILGYKGDALYLLDEVDAARRSYLTALLLDPLSVDADNLCDPDTRELLCHPGTYLDELDVPEGPWSNDRHWAAVAGILAGIFLPPPVFDAVQVSEWWDVLYNDHASQGTAFAAGMILSAQGMKPLSLVDIDISAVRNRMRKISPELFAVFMRN